MAEPSEYVTLVSCDDFRFVVRRSAACISQTIKRMLETDSGFIESQTNVCVLSDIYGVVLERVCEYMYYNEKHMNSKDIPNMEIPDELCLELVMAADYLDV